MLKKNPWMTFVAVHIYTFGSRAHVVSWSQPIVHLRYCTVKWQPHISLKEVSLCSNNCLVHFLQLQEIWKNRTNLFHWLLFPKLFAKPLMFSVNQKSLQRSPMSKVPHFAMPVWLAEHAYTTAGKPKLTLWESLAKLMLSTRCNAKASCS